MFIGQSIRECKNTKELGFLLGACTLLGKQHSLDVGQDTALGNGDSSKKLVQLLVVPDSKLQMPWDDARLLIVSGSIASQLQDLSSQIFHDSGHINWRTGAHPLGIITLPQQPVDPAHGKLKTSPARTGLCLALHLATLSASRHGNQWLIKIS